MSQSNNTEETPENTLVCGFTSLTGSTSCV